MAPLPVLHKKRSATDMTTSTESSSPDTPPSIKPEMSPATMQQILNEYYTNWTTHFGSPTASLQPHRTTKASLLLDALLKDAITRDELDQYTRCIEVKSIAPTPFLDSRSIDVTMCVDEGTLVDFMRELARLFEIRPKDQCEARLISRDEHLIRVQFRGYENV